MNIVVLSQLFPPETAAGANRVSALVNALESRHTVRVVTLEPGYPDPSLYRRADWQAADHARTIRIERQPAFRPHDSSLARRALRELIMSVALAWRARGGRPDVVVVSTPSMFLAPLGWLLARVQRARFVWDVRDLTWRYALESVPSGGLQRRALLVLERFMLWLLRRSDLVIAATAGLASVLQAQAVPAERMLTLPNGVTRAFLAKFPSQPVLSSRVESARPQVAYVGLMGYNHGIGIFLEVARLLPGIDLHLVGDGPERPAIEARLRDGALPNVHLHGYITDSAELVRRYEASDVLINHTKDAPILNDIVYPAKLSEYFATGRPVVYAGSGFAADVFRSRDLAEVTAPGDSAAIAAGIERVLADPVRAHDRACRARAMVEAEFCRESQLESLLTELERRFGGRRG